MAAESRDLAEFRDRIAAWHAAGLGWREIGDELAALGVDVHWNAVWHYARTAGIPTGRVKKSAAVISPSVIESTVVVPVSGILLGGFVSWATPAAEPEAESIEVDRAAAPPAPQPVPRPEPGWQFYRKPQPLFTPLRSSEWEADMTVLEFGDEDRWTLQDSFEGTLVTGATGSGKTSGSGRMLAESFLSLGFGGLILTAKTDEADLWQKYADRTNRMGQLCRFRPGGPFKFNFLDYQTRLPESRGGSTENVVDLFYSVLEAFSRTKRTVDSFWSNAAKQLLRNVVRVFRAAGEAFNLKTIRHFISEMPRSLDETKSGYWKTSPTFGRLILAAKKNSTGQLAADLEEAFRYWLADFPGLYHETRSIVTTDFAALVDLMFEPAIWDLFGGETTITPETVFDGAIIVVDLPIKKHHATGRLAQLFWKHLFQLAVERRSDADGASRRPVFLWCDEAQLFAAETDLMFQGTARSSRCATVYLTQTYPGFQAAMGGDHAKERTDGLFANLTTKIIHANGDPTSNEWAASQIGKVLQYRANVTVNRPSEPRGFSFREVFANLTRQPQRSAQTSQVVDFEIQPSEFSQLRTGSAKNGGLVDGYFVKPGAAFSGGRHYFKATFQQG